MWSLAQTVRRALPARLGVDRHATVALRFVCIRVSLFELARHGNSVYYICVIVLSVCVSDSSQKWPVKTQTRTRRTPLH